MFHGPIKICLALLFLVGSVCCSGPDLTDYIPKNEDEKEIVSLLVQYQNAKINCDLDLFLSCLHETGQYHFGRGSMVSKKVLRESLPAFWDELKTGNPAFYPMNREMITGNYIRTGRFVNPRIVIGKDTAQVTITYMKWGWRLRHYVSMLRENERWVINRLDWETN